MAEEDVGATTNGTFYVTDELYLFLQSVTMSIYAKNNDNANIGVRTVSFDYLGQNTTSTFENETIM